MPKTEVITPTVLETVETTNKMVIDPKTTRIHGSGSAYQAVSQTMAMTVQDASALLRNINTLSTTAMGVATAKLISDGDPKMAAVIQQAQQTIENAAETFKTIGTYSGDILKNFPTGE